MTYTVFMQRQDPYSHGLLFEVFDENRDVIAEIKKDKKNNTYLYYKDAVYNFPFSIKSVDAAIFPFEYPISSNRNSRLGLYVLKNNTMIAEYYGEVAIVEKRKIFSKKISFEVYKYNSNAYYMIKVGLPKKASHFYCLFDATTKQTVGIIERLQANPEEARSKIYLLNNEYIELMLILLSSETVMNVTANNEGQIIDPSAGKYISTREEEIKFYDKDFVELAKRK